ncbi:molybdopterin-dependent oxidoreductase [Streptomyces mirabilis]|uniref:molybdopterin-dependent oxidoreductase n=1 Tax=Streptomyces mirabilis TaxID=68239 RepID=UPI003F4BABAE
MAVGTGDPSGRRETTWSARRCHRHSREPCPGSTVSAPWAAGTQAAQWTGRPEAGDHEWFGIVTTTVLDLAPPSPDAMHVVAWAGYGYAANMRLRDFTAPETLLPPPHNGELLTAEHGFPLRHVVPHLYGYESPKWLRGDRRRPAGRSVKE